MYPDYSNGLSKKVIKSVLDILILQIIKDEPMCRNKILSEINYKFNISLNSANVYSALSCLQEQGLIIYNSDKMPTLTKKGEALRKRLMEDYFRLQKTIELNL